MDRSNERPAVSKRFEPRESAGMDDDGAVRCEALNDTSCLAERVIRHRDYDHVRIRKRRWIVIAVKFGDERMPGTLECAREGTADASGAEDRNPQWARRRERQ